MRGTKNGVRDALTRGDVPLSARAVLAFMRLEASDGVLTATLREMAEELGMPERTLKHHIAVLRKASLVGVATRGSWLVLERTMGAGKVQDVAPSKVQDVAPSDPSKVQDVAPSARDDAVLLTTDKPSLTTFEKVAPNGATRTNVSQSNDVVEERRFPVGPAGVRLIERIDAIRGEGAKGWDLAFEAQAVWDELAQTSNPAVALQRFVADLVNIYSDGEDRPSFPRIGRLLKGYGKSALYGVLVGMEKGLVGDSLYNYATAVAKGQRHEIRRAKEREAKNDGDTEDASGSVAIADGRNGRASERNGTGMPALRDVATAADAEHGGRRENGAVVHLRDV